MKAADLLKKLVQIESVSGEEGEIIDFLQKYCEGKNLEPQKLDNNVIFSIGRGEKKLVFNAHIDTVEASGDWDNGPFGAE
ncbi:MAG: peptidase M20, partial [Candidatus Nanohaloarchaea archaeon]